MTDKGRKVGAKGKRVKVGQGDSREALDAFDDDVALDAPGEWEHSDEELVEIVSKIVHDLEGAGVRFLTEEEFKDLGLDKYGPGSEEAKKIRADYLAEKRRKQAN
jgi:hypothetical protein